MSEIRKKVGNLWKRHSRPDIVAGGPTGAGYGLTPYGQGPYGG